MAARSIAEPRLTRTYGEIIATWSARSTLIASGIQPDFFSVVQADRWWYPEGTRDSADPFGLWATNINVCTADDDTNVDPVMGAWLLRGLPCRVTAIKAQAAITPA